MTKTLFSTICLVVIFFNLKAQNKIYLKSVAGAYDLGDLKGIVTDAVVSTAGTDRPYRAISEFSWSLQVEAGYMRNLSDKNVLSISMNYMGTEGGIAYQDEGSDDFLVFDLDRWGFNVEWQRQFFNRIYGLMRGSLHYSNLKRESRSRFIPGDWQELNLKHHSWTPAVTAGLGWQKSFDRLTVLVEGGYEFTVWPRTFQSRDGGPPLFNANSKLAVTDWSGWRLGLGVALSL